jgi:WD40 repeat protein
VRCSVDGDLVASGSIDGVVKVHSLTEKRCVFELKLPGAPIQGLQFDPSGRFLVRCPLSLAHSTLPLRGWLR